MKDETNLCPSGRILHRHSPLTNLHVAYMSNDPDSKVKPFLAASERSHVTDGQHDLRPVGNLTGRPASYQRLVRWETVTHGKHKPGLYKNVQSNLMG